MRGMSVQPPPCTQARHSATVTSYMPSAKGLESVTLWPGCSLGSPRVTPMVKVPAGTFTMTGHSGQSWKLLDCPLLRVAGRQGRRGVGRSDWRDG